MASLVLSLAGAAVGSVFGPAGAIIGRLAGALAGSALDQTLFGASHREVQGPRLSDLDVMASTEGAPIPRVYGRARLSGQVIWATPLEESISTETQGGKGGTGASTTTTTYSYFANVAVGLCEGPIGRVGRIWADGKLLDTTGLNIRFHRGDETQSPDELIVAKEGAGNAPAYRGLAYVVFERLPLADYGNRIPQLSFEIVRPVGALEQMVRAVTLIPGTTEFGYEPATVVQMPWPGVSSPENRHVGSARSDVVAALDDLQSLCPNLERVAIVVAWFGTDLRAGQCSVMPGVENLTKATFGGTWSVAGLPRAFAHAVSQVNGGPAYGGTPSDDSVRHLIAELKARELKVTFYPFVMMDIAPGNALADPWSGATSQPAYPWRGRITCDPAPGRPGSPQGTATAATQVNAFFAGTAPGAWCYRRMVLHYASLCAAAGGVDAFLIGSELRALTRVRSGAGVYPAVDALVMLAGDVKAIVGGSTRITYGADWTEYGADVVDDTASEVRFPLDPLWASDVIDMVGIDYYAPLADWRDNAAHLDAAPGRTIHDPDYLQGNVRGGEAYDWFYTDDAARAVQARTPISDGLGKSWTFRQKDLVNWWSNAHHERVGGIELPGPTAWVPQGKPIWLTEVGCPAVDKGANQPNVFPDPKSSESFVPHFSSGARDDLMQRRYLEAVLSAFDPEHGADGTHNPVSSVYGGRMVEPSGIHLWTWDARPYPVFPAAHDLWSDAPNWQTGHWLTGRLGGAPLDALVASILADCGIGDAEASALRHACEGYVVDRPMTPRAMIDPLAMLYGFDASAGDGSLRFVQRGGAPVVELSEDDFIDSERGVLATLVRAQETELPRDISIGFTDALTDYRRAAVASRKLVGGAQGTAHADLALIADAATIAPRAEIRLQDLWAGRESATFALGLRHLKLIPGMVIAATIAGRRRLFEITEIVDAQARQVKARSIDPDVFSVPLLQPAVGSPAIPPPLGPAQVHLLDLPVIDSVDPAVLTRVAVFADPWPGPVAVWRSTDGASFQVAAVAGSASVMGVTLDPLPSGPLARWDRAHMFRVRLSGGMLSSASEARVLGGANAAALRNPEGAWEIIQFANAELIDAATYRLSRLLRGQAGSEAAMVDPLPPGAAFVLLNAAVTPLARGLDALERPAELRVIAASRGYDDPASVSLSLAPSATALRPLAPAQLRARRIAGGVLLSWIRRTRIDGDGWGVEVPLGEESEAYRLEILSGAAVLRSMTLTVSQMLYASADELADFGAPQTVLHLRVAQLSATVGAGFTADAVVTVG